MFVNSQVWGPYHSPHIGNISTHTVLYNFTFTMYNHRVVNSQVLVMSCVLDINAGNLQCTIFHAASVHFTEHNQLVLFIGFKSLPDGLPGVKGFIAAHIGRNPSSSNSHPHRICNFRTLSTELDSNADDQYSQLKRFTVRDLTN